VNKRIFKVNLANNLNIFKNPVFHKPAILDSGCSSHYLKRGAYCINKWHAHLPIKVKLPDGTTLASSATADLACTTFYLRERYAHIINDLASHSILSCGQMCDAGYKVLFDEGRAQVMEGNVSVQGRIVMHGQRDHSTGLWTVPLDANSTKKYESIKSVYEISKVYNAIQYLHKAAGSPVPSTFVRAMKAGNFTAWPTLTPEHVNKYLKKSEATVKGHLNQTRKNVRSMKPKKKPGAQEETQYYEPQIMERTNVVYAAIHDIEGHTYTDLTGLFPKTSSRGYKYVLVLYDYDGNSIQAEAMKNRSDAEAIRAYSKIYDELTSKGLIPKFQTMDNEASTALKHFLHSKDIQFQLFPPYVHRQNDAERAIQTFKNHAVATLCSIDTYFHIHFWDRFIPQAVITLNLLRQSRINPKVSAHAQLNIMFDYNKTPLAPPVTEVIIHKKTDHRGSWSPHGINGWYVGPAIEHYRAHRVYCSTTGHVRISDTVEFFPSTARSQGSPVQMRRQLRHWT
jgi:hypothetical protein